MTQPSSRNPTGYQLLHDPRFNKGTAFTEAERHKYGLEGLLPPAVSSIDLQIARRHAEIANLDDDLQKYLVLSDLQARNERLFYAVLMSDPATYMPLVYTPTVGEACQKFAHIFREGRGIYLAISARGRVRELLSNWPERDVRFIVVTDGERILGLGDLGAGGMGIPIGKLALYTACAGVPPQYCLPVVLDVGTNHQALIEDSLYLGLRQPRVRGEDYMAFVDEFVAAAQALYPKCCIQWEDFANINAVPILARYRDKVCTYNDDIQGTAGVALAGILAALRITGQKLTDQRFLFLGGGSAGTGIAELISQVMALEGMDIAAARRRNALFDINGLLVASRVDLADFQKPFAQNRAPVATLSRRSRRSDRPASSASAPCRSCSPARSSRRWPRSTSGRSSFRIRIRPRVPNAPPRRPIAGPAGGPSLPAAARFRQWKWTAAGSSPVRATMSTSFQRWGWPCLQPKRAG
jgi:malate dehydrogenase (oxaloacetate-decarboxylating)(NADP+)